MDSNSGTGNDDGRAEAACAMNSAAFALFNAKRAAVARAEKLDNASARFDAAVRSGNLKAVKSTRVKLDIEREMKAGADKAVVDAEALLAEKKRVYARMVEQLPVFEEKRYPIPHVETPSKREAAGEGLPPYTHYDYNDTAPAAAAAAAAAAANRGAGMGRYLIEREAAKEAMMEAQYAAAAIAERAANSDVRARGDSQPKQAQALASVNSDVRAREVCATGEERTVPMESAARAAAPSVTLGQVPGLRALVCGDTRPASASAVIEAEDRVSFGKIAAGPGESFCDAARRIESFAGEWCSTIRGGKSVHYYTGVFGGRDSASALLCRSDTFKAMTTEDERAQAVTIYESDSMYDAAAALDYLEYFMTKNKRTHKRAPCDGQGVWCGRSTKFFVRISSI
jgi:hypothetical protein